MCRDVVGYCSVLASLDLLELGRREPQSRVGSHELRNVAVVGGVEVVAVGGCRAGEGL